MHEFTQKCIQCTNIYNNYSIFPRSRSLRISSTRKQLCYSNHGVVTALHSDTSVFRQPSSDKIIMIYTIGLPGREKENTGRNEGMHFLFPHYKTLKDHYTPSHSLVVDNYRSKRSAWCVFRLARSELDCAIPKSSSRSPVRNRSKMQVWMFAYFLLIIIYW